MINVKLDWPPTVNHYYTVARNRKILSTKGKNYKADMQILLNQQQPKKGLEGRLEVRIEAYPPDNRKRDLDNILKPLLDSLQDYGMFDDSQVDDLRIRRMRKNGPGFVRVHIWEL